jgi:hypothetical protein
MKYPRQQKVGIFIDFMLFFMYFKVPAHMKQLVFMGIHHEVSNTGLRDSYLKGFMAYGIRNDLDVPAGSLREMKRGYGMN